MMLPWMDYIHMSKILPTFPDLCQSFVPIHYITITHRCRLCPTLPGSPPEPGVKALWVFGILSGTLSFTNSVILSRWFLLLSGSSNPLPPGFKASRIPPPRAMLPGMLDSTMGWLPSALRYAPPSPVEVHVPEAPEDEEPGFKMSLSLERTDLSFSAEI
ncbi:uncharacterized protein BCR38DRAFT_431431, partial [Pseudomassariella vexata]